MRESLRLALDKSVRSYDEDGHLHVSMANISKAVVNPYRGSEIPDYRRLGLDANKIYQLLRHPDELARGAHTFSGKPILSVHRPTTATDHAKHITVGSVGSKPHFDGKYLQAPLTVWDATAIDGIESDDQRELSSAYRYDADMTPGMYRGIRYDGVMRNIRGNHVALVESGRAGSDVIVGDAALVPATDATLIVKGPSAMKLSRAALLASGALRVYLAPKLATDARVDLGPVLQGVTAKGWKAGKPKMARALAVACKGKLAQDATIADVLQMLDQLDEVAQTLPDATAAEPGADPGADPNMPGAEPDPMADPNMGALPDDPADPTDPTDPGAADPADDPTLPAGDPDDPDDDSATDGDGDMVSRVMEFLSSKLQPEDLATVKTMMKPEVDPAAGPPAPAQDNEAGLTSRQPFPLNKKEVAVDKGLTKAAMDAAIAVASAKSAKAAEKATIQRMNAIREAERVVRPWVGEVALGQDSAEAVYKMALDQAGIDLTGVPEVAYRAVLSALPNPQAEAAERARSGRALTMDAAGAKKFAERFPNANRLQQQH